MASSKDDAKPRKIVDVAGPGKSAPSATSRPIIVTNRPMLKQDPMMAPTEDTDKSDGPEQPVSRVAKTIKIIATDTAPAAEAENLPATTPAGDVKPSAPPVEAAQPEASVKPLKTIKPITIKHADQEVALKVGVEALASLEDGTDKVAETKSAEIAPEATVPVIPMFDSSSEETIADPERPTLVAVSVSPPTKEASNPAPAEASEAKEQPATTASEPDEEPAKVDDAAVEVPSKPEEQAPAPAPTPAASTTEPAPDATSDTDQQLPANQVLEDEKRKQDEAAAQLLAEQEKIIASKRYYLPIKSRNKRRGVVRAVVILILVLLLSLVWLDVVLDAGIVHISGLQPVTNFFQ